VPWGNGYLPSIRHQLYQLTSFVRSLGRFPRKQKPRIARPVGITDRSLNCRFLWIGVAKTSAQGDQSPLRAGASAHFFWVSQPCLDCPHRAAAICISADQLGHPGKFQSVAGDQGRQFVPPRLTHARTNTAQPPHHGRGLPAPGATGKRLHPRTHPDSRNGGRPPSRNQPPQ